MFFCCNSCTTIFVLPPLLSIMLLYVAVTAQETGSYIYDRLFSDLQQNYNYRVRPNFGEKPVVVTVFLRVASLRSISEQTMDYKMELYYREYWTDPRLAFSPENYGNLTIVPLHETMATSIWIPDTFLPNAIFSVNPAVNSITHRSLLRLRNDGNILYSRRLSVTAECPMDLTLFPFDVQVCRLSIESYGGDINSVIYQWRHPPSSAVVLDESLTLPDFRIKGILVKNRNISLLTGTYSRLEFCFVLQRSSGFYITHLFIPATAVVATAWISLRMEKESTFSDMISIMLSVTFLYYSYNAVMPKVSYIKAMDVFLGLCFLFVFSALIVLAFLKHLRDEATEYMKDTESRDFSFIKSVGQNWFRTSLISKIASIQTTAGLGGGMGMGPVAPDREPNNVLVNRLRPTVSAESNNAFFDAAADPPSMGLPPPQAPSASASAAAESMRKKSVMQERRHAQLWRRLRHARRAAVAAYPCVFLLAAFIYVIWLVTVDKHDSMGNCTF